MSKLRIAVISTEGQGLGGAVRATRRLVEGLTRHGHHVRLISLDAYRAPDGLGVGVSRSPSQRLAVQANAMLQRAYIRPRRTSVSNTYFSAEAAGYHLRDVILGEQADVINLHWVANFLAPHTIAELTALGRPVVQTLHDMAAFTGGCHYSAGCEQYREECSPCPQLTNDVLNLPGWTLAQKRRPGAMDRIAAVAPSRWMRDCAAASGLFAPGRVYRIPNGLDTDLFRPTETSQAKALLGIDPGVKTLLFGADHHREHRKGLDLALQAWQGMASQPAIRELLARQRIRLLTFGNDHRALDAAGIPLQHMGSVRNDSRLALIYSAADLVLLTSREDNLPNILLEAMACGTPVVGFGVGGVPDVIEHDQDGLLIPAFDTDAMARSAVELLTSEARVATLGSAARRKMVEHYPLDIQAAAYEELFREMIETSGGGERRAGPTLAANATRVVADVSVNPTLQEHPLGLFLKQCAIVERWRQRDRRHAYEISRVRDVLGTALTELKTSRSWQAIGGLRGVRQASSAAVPPSEDLAVSLLESTRSKSWEITAPIRLSLRLLRRAFGPLRPAGPTDRSGAGMEGANTLPPSTFALQLPLAATAAPPSHSARPGLDPLCLHLFHLDLWSEFSRALKPLVGPKSPLFVTLPAANAHFVPTIHREFGNTHCEVFVLENRGLDVYPFLVIVDHLLTKGETPRTLTKLHTKKSAHHDPAGAAAWRRELYQGLLTHHPVLTDLFDERQLAMICSRTWWVHEDETSANFRAERRVIGEACRIFGVSRTEHYLSGSMYVISFAYLEKLFHDVDRAQLLASFPPGYQRSDTLAHGFERAVCYGVEKFGLKVGLL